MLTYEEAHYNCLHSQPFLKIENGKAVRVKCKHGNSIRCTANWDKAMAEFKSRLPHLKSLEERGEVAYVYSNGFVLPKFGNAVWHTEIQ